MKEAIYRLGEYKIIESDTGQLIWEAHFGFCEFQMGHCFRKGSILFIGPAENRCNGFLKGEFLDDLKKYPQWDNTKFYCMGVGVRHCMNGKGVTKEEMMLWTLDQRHGEGATIHPGNLKRASNSGAAAGKIVENAAYRLQQFEITIKPDGQIISRTHSGSNAVSSGNSFILEGILFIGPRRNEPSNLNKRQFLANLRQLPKWDQTDFFCQKLSLRGYIPGNRRQKGQKGSPHESRRNKKHDAGYDYVADPETKILNGTNHGKFSARFSGILGSFVNFAKRRYRQGRLSPFSVIKSYLWDGSTIFRASGIMIMKRTTRTVVRIFRIIASLLVLMIGYLKKYHEKWHDKMNKPSSDHHMDR